MPRISEVVAYPIELQLKEAFETAKGRKTTSPTVIIELRLENGVVGYGSATPLKYVTGEDTATVTSAIEMIAPDLEGCDIRRYLSIFETLAEILPDDHTARAGLEIAIFDAFCKVYNLSMFHFFGGAVEQVQTDVTIPICPPDEARFAAERAASQGFRCLKIKVG
ncbi:MAG: dipeptide epimerase, partial [Armatimonadota bacterium]|nr:dipeptide epimerase [Armatimonadota bacterium]